jgi:Protein of unknown function (DUF642)
MKSTLLNTVLRGRNAALATLALAAMVSSAYASPIVNNGGFSGPSTSGEISNGSYSGVTLPGWTNANGSYNFVFTSGSALAPNQFGNTVSFYGPPTSSPNGGNFVALSSDFNQGTISQTISGLTAGKTYIVSFDYAGAQQKGYSGASSDYLAVSLGGQTDDTPTLNDPSNGFTGWNSDTLEFTATSTSETLSFLAVGTPSGVPSFALLDGVSISQTPEPGSLVLLSTGLIGLSGFVRSRFKKS